MEFDETWIRAAFRRLYEQEEKLWLSMPADPEPANPTFQMKLRIPSSQYTGSFPAEVIQHCAEIATSRGPVCGYDGAGKPIASAPLPSYPTACEAESLGYWHKLCDDLEVELRREVKWKTREWPICRVTGKSVQLIRQDGADHMYLFFVCGDCW